MPPPISEKNPITSCTCAVYGATAGQMVVLLSPATAGSRLGGWNCQYSGCNTMKRVELEWNTKKAAKVRRSRRAWTSAPRIPLLCQPTPPVCKVIYLQQESCRRISPLLQRSTAVRRQTYREIKISTTAWIYSTASLEMSRAWVHWLQVIRPVLAWLYQQCNLLSCFQATCYNSTICIL